MYRWTVLLGLLILKGTHQSIFVYNNIKKGCFRKGSYLPITVSAAMDSVTNHSSQLT